MFTTGKIKERKEPSNIDVISKMLYPSLQEQVHLVEVNSDNGIFHIFLIYNYN